MGWDRDNTDYDDQGTEQQRYYAHLDFLRRAGKTAQADRLAAGGPPPPRKADGPEGWLAWHEHHPPTPEELDKLVDRLLDAGQITASQLTGHTLAPHDTATIATLRALIGARVTSRASTTPQ
ncbi:MULTISPECIES: hypothetical protein [Nocardia]|uniref:Uncharacterized protein n=1 Tax=Nocardia asteroides NBRC 15531 TaxID=1110697 RepID=U5EPR2_NOCAS|nr:hypothetical protein [Nocardia asteroides]TLF63368.1 hypothetical protein FEK33_25365 [Nocardia asteroides NBRC 15531]UGT47206.1 hypothetical protein LT345_22160 [Nocardia asteroides]SFM76388.1 hypothetical protein SAMN05444423_104142 [Nocardia asteroides]VEG33910.1 Uncharacterised protein [Nocardia asteroides]GAD87069.1 hypothetical protein NCAST_34_01970 [Nocardia asteroides NBRC 15531]